MLSYICFAHFHSAAATEMKVGGSENSTFIGALCVPELMEMKETSEGLHVGASCSLHLVAEKMKELIFDLPCKCFEPNIYIIIYYPYIHSCPNV